MARKAQSATVPYVPGHIEPNSLYTLEDVQRRLGLGVHAMRQARRRGLVVHRFGRRAFVLGADLIEVIRGSTK